MIISKKKKSPVFNKHMLWGYSLETKQFLLSTHKCVVFFFDFFFFFFFFFL